MSSDVEVQDGLDYGDVQYGPLVTTIKKTMEKFRGACATYQFEMIGVCSKDVPFLKDELDSIAGCGNTVIISNDLEPGEVGVRVSDIHTERVVDWVVPIAGHLRRITR